MRNAEDNPGFLIIGAQKCGTSWLHQQLSQHPELYLPPQKELEFFSYAPHLDDPGIAAYRELFSTAHGRLGGEATPSYFWSWSDSPWCRMPEGFQHDIPRTVRELLGENTRLILCLRDPVERALSAWGHYLAHGEVDPTLTFTEAASFGGIIDMGFYARHLSTWLAHFPLKQFLILSLEQHINADPQAALGRVHSFLGVSDMSTGHESANRVVFPGPVREDNGEGRIIHFADQTEPAFVSNAEISWLQALYKNDQVKLKALSGDDSRQRG